MTITNGYATLLAVKNELAITVSTWDTKLEGAINAASRQIDKWTGRPHGFWQDASVVAREFYAEDAQCVYIPEGISTTVGLIVKTDTDGDGVYENTMVINTNFFVAPVNAGDQIPVEPYTRLVIADYLGSYFPTGNQRPGVQVTAKFGWPAVPDDVAKACIIQAVQLYKASDAVFGAIQLGDGFATRVGKGLNPLAESLLEGYSMPRVG